MFRINIIPPKIKKGISDKIKEVVDAETKRAINASLIDIKAAMVEASPVGLGTLKQSWLIKPARRLGKTIQGSVVSNAIQATIVEKGAAPHTPPSTALRPWIRRTLGVTDEAGIFVATRAIQRKIATQGIAAKKTFSKAFDAIEPTILANLKASQNRIASKINRLFR